ncbi:MAG: tRNA dihydrouridine synthase [Thermodesulfobacteriota bacterium]
MQKDPNRTAIPPAGLFPQGHSLPWSAGATPLMLAPMQGLTNRGLRALYAERFRPDVLFTEFVRVKESSKKNISANDLLEVASPDKGTPLVIQLIGHQLAALLPAAETVQGLGVEHLNINLGCPYGRMSNNAAGGGLLRQPEQLADILRALRQAARGGFSVKVRAGFDDPAQLFDLLPLFEETGIDFLILHARTVVQRYSGHADHRITAEVVSRTRLPVIANGDIFSAAEGQRVLAETGAAGLMLGRGAMNDPWLFERIRGNRPPKPDTATRQAELHEFLAALFDRYQALFCGDHQILCKLKGVIAFIHDPEFARPLRKLLKSKSLEQFHELLAGMAP